MYGNSGSQTAHSHTSGTLSTNSDSHSHTITVSVADTRTSIAPIGYRAFTPVGSSFNIKLRGLRSGTLGSWNHEIVYEVLRG